MYQEPFCPSFQARARARWTILGNTFWAIEPDQKLSPAARPGKLSQGASIPSSRRRCPRRTWGCGLTSRASPRPMTSSARTCASTSSRGRGSRSTTSSPRRPWRTCQTRFWRKEVNNQTFECNGAAHFIDSTQLLVALPKSNSAKRRIAAIFKILLSAKQPRIQTNCS